MGGAHNSAHSKSKYFHDASKILWSEKHLAAVIIWQVHPKPQFPRCMGIIAQACFSKCCWIALLTALAISVFILMFCYSDWCEVVSCFNLHFPNSKVSSIISQILLLSISSCSVQPSGLCFCKLLFISLDYFKNGFSFLLLMCMIKKYLSCTGLLTVSIVFFVEQKC